MSFAFAINPGLDVAALADLFAAHRRLSILDFLDPRSATALHDALVLRDDWVQLINAGDQVYELGKAALEAMTAAQHAELMARVHAKARDGFQFRFSSIRVPDPIRERQLDSDILHAFAEFMSGPEVLSLLQRITGRNGVAFADAQATAYHAGDFLTGHDDDIEGKNRKLAYVIGLTTNWRTEWGGLLLFHDSDGSVSGFAPRFNCLNIFALPALHSVSEVTAYAGAVRYSITGWLRSQRPV